MTKDKAIKAVANYSQLQTGGLNNNEKIAIAEMIETAKQVLLYHNHWTFARGKVHVKFPFPFFYDTLLQTLNTTATATVDAYQNLLKHFDFFYLKDNYSIEAILEFYNFIKMYGVRVQRRELHQFSNPIFDLLRETYSDPDSTIDPQGLQDYFDFYIKFCKADNMSVYANYAYVFDDVGGLLCSPMSILHSVNFEEYKKSVNTFLDSYYKKYIVFFNGDSDKIAKFYGDIKKEKFNFIQETNIDCTLNKDIEDLPDVFMNIVCRVVAKEKLTAMGKLDQARILHAEAKAEQERYIVSERASGDVREDTQKYSIEEEQLYDPIPRVIDGEYHCN